MFLARDMICWENGFEDISIAGYFQFFQSLPAFLKHYPFLQWHEERGSGSVSCSLRIVNEYVSRRFKKTP